MQVLWLCGKSCVRVRSGVSSTSAFSQARYAFKRVVSAICATDWTAVWAPLPLNGQKLTTSGFATVMLSVAFHRLSHTALKLKLTESQQASTA